MESPEKRDLTDSEKPSKVVSKSVSKSEGDLMAGLWDIHNMSTDYDVDEEGDPRITKGSRNEDFLGKE
jgi:hypothetical protein